MHWKRSNHLKALALLTLCCVACSNDKRVCFGFDGPQCEQYDPNDRPTTLLIRNQNSLTTGIVPEPLTVTGTTYLEGPIGAWHVAGETGANVAISIPSTNHVVRFAEYTSPQASVAPYVAPPDSEATDLVAWNGFWIASYDSRVGAAGVLDIVSSDANQFSSLLNRLPSGVGHHTILTVDSEMLLVTSDQDCNVMVSALAVDLGGSVVRQRDFPLRLFTTAAIADSCVSGSAFPSEHRVIECAPYSTASGGAKAACYLADGQLALLDLASGEVDLQSGTPAGNGGVSIQGNYAFLWSSSGKDDGSSAESACQVGTLVLWQLNPVQYVSSTPLRMDGPMCSRHLDSEELQVDFVDALVTAGRAYLTSSANSHALSTQVLLLDLSKLPALTQLNSLTLEANSGRRLRTSPDQGNTVIFGSNVAGSVTSYFAHNGNLDSFHVDPGFSLLSVINQ